jgi:hypothetical protein
MKRHLRGLFLVAALVAPALADTAADTTGKPAKVLGKEQRAHMLAASDPSLGSMRAGRDQGAKPMLDSTRSALRSAESDAPELGAMRGGIDTVEVLLIVVLVLLIVILI